MIITKDSTTLKLPILLVDKWEELFGKLTGSSMEEILGKVPFESWKQLDKEIRTYDDDFYLYLILEEYTDRINTTSKPIRISPVLKDWIERHFETSTKTTGTDKPKQTLYVQFSIVMAELIYINKQGLDISPSTLETPIFHLHGNKNWFRPNFKELLEELPSPINSSLELFGGTGILSTDISKNGHFSKILYNDDDRDKVDFFKVLKKSPGKLNLYCQYFTHHPEKVTELENSKHLSSFERAVLFWCKNPPSSRKTGTLFSAASILYTNVEFSNSDALKCLQKHLNEDNLLILCDSPYIYTKGYENRNTQSKQKDFTYADFERFAKEILKAKGIFLFFCRITASRSYYIPEEQQNTEADKYIRGKIDDCFINKGLFYKDFSYGNHGTIERVITNHPFNDFLPYSSHC